jgi:hypothetical protein
VGVLVIGLVIGVLVAVVLAILIDDAGEPELDDGAPTSFAKRTSSNANRR